ncbi:MAG: isoprenylcysteine carboxylmethyltransferase family protein [Flavobacteriaceae bacterium]|nr:isoprenylcysteine carboxylmethyltransferase family protein [Flavobacteriaceae bacterium]
MKKDFFYVLLQFTLFALYIINWNLGDLHLLGWIKTVFITLTGFGLLVILFGIINLNENLSPFPTPKRNATLISHGIYKYVRHPIYSGLIISMFSYALVSESIFRIISATLLLLVFYFKSDYEEKKLVERFDEYDDYKKVTGRFFPKRTHKKS